MREYGVSEEQLKDLTGTALSGGVEMLWRTSQAWISKQEEEVLAAYQVEKARREAARADGSGDDTRHPFEDDATVSALLGHETPETRKAAVLEQLAQARARPQPIWQDITGLHQPEYAMTPGERAGRIRKLLRAVERVARVELRTEEERCGGDWRMLRIALDPDNPDELDGRSHAWDPLRSVCFYFGIAKTKLGAYAQEIWGMSAPQIFDRAKCEFVHGKIRSELKAFLVKQGDVPAEEAWAAWREARKGVSKRTELATRFGFSSYARYFRACVLCYGIEPVALEREIFEELVTEPGAAVKREESEGPKVEGHVTGEEVEKGNTLRIDAESRPRYTRAV